MRPRTRRLAAPAVLCALAASGAACAATGPRRPSAEEAVLARRTEGLRSLVRAAEAGPLIALDQMLLVVDQGLVQDLLASATPFERVIGGKYRVRIEAARVAFDDGFALVRLDGTASLARGGDTRTSADLSVFGGLDVVELDPASGILRGEVRVIALEARRVDVLGVQAPAERLVEELGREKLEDFGELVSGIEIPVRLEREVRLPAVGPEGGVRIAAATVPLRASVRDVKAFRGKLWISVGVSSVREDAPGGGTR